MSISSKLIEKILVYEKNKKTQYIIENILTGEKLFMIIILKQYFEITYSSNIHKMAPTSSSTKQI